MNEFIAKFAGESEDSAAAIIPVRRVVILPAGDRADQLTAVMLAQALQFGGFSVLVLPPSAAPGDSFANQTVEPADTICISALHPFALMNARTSSKRLRARFPRHRILVGLWSRTGEVEDFEERLTKAFDVQVVTTLTEALQNLTVDAESQTEAALSGSGLV
jgi:hypothetical protein